ncbi:MAG: hypothetical protein PSY14_11255 [bacterium]|nr:hypothetical protein [bacterium]
MQSARYIFWALSFLVIFSVNCAYADSAGEPPAGVTMEMARPEISEAAAEDRKKQSEEIETRKAAFKRCNIPYPGTPYKTIFKNIKKVNFFLEVQPSDFGVRQCHGREEECADQNALVKLDPQKRQEWVQYLKDQYASYPESLYPENLIAIFKKRINTQILPFIIPADDCKIPELEILDTQSLRKLENEVNFALNQDALTILVRLTILHPAQPEIATLTSYVYRPNEGLLSFYGLSQSIAILLNENPAELQRQLQAFAKNINVYTQENSPE